MTRLIAILLVFFTTFGVGHAQSGFGLKAEARLVSERAQAMAGETFYFGLELKMEPEWHVYWQNAGDAGLPPELIWAQDHGASFEPFVWPIPELLPVAPDEIMDYGYSDTVVLPFAVTIPETASGQYTFQAEADYLICKDICIPEAQPVSFDLLVGSEQIPDLIGSEAIAGALSQTPEAFIGRVVVDKSGPLWRLSLAPEAGAFQAETLRYFPFGHEIRHAAVQNVSFGQAGATLILEPADDAQQDAQLKGVVIAEAANGARQGFVINAEAGAVLPGTTGQTSGAGNSLLAILGLAILGGLVLNLMPCVLPVLSIKAVGMVQAAASGEKSHLRLHGLVYTAGVLVSFLATAIVFLVLRGAGEFVPLGFQLQYGSVVAVLALIMFVIGLWLFGVFELGTSVQGVGSGLAAKQGSVGAFFTGVLAAIVGAPCVGPFLGVALGSVISRPTLEVLLVFAALGLGLALPFLALSFAPGLHKVLPKPGVWMERLKQFFAFPMFITAAWLVSVLADQAGSGAVAMTLVGAALIGFGIWVLQSSEGRFKSALLAAGGLAIIAGFFIPVPAAMNKTPAGATTAYAASEIETIAWSPDAVQSALADGKGVFVDFTASWCVTCQLNKRSTLTTQAVQQAMIDNNIVFMVADFTNKGDVIAEELKKTWPTGRSDVSSLWGR